MSHEAFVLQSNLHNSARNPPFLPVFPPFLYTQKCHKGSGGESEMCTVGGGPDIGDIESLVAKDYECLDCKNKFKGMGRRPMCPSCKSRNVKAV